ncbi:MAG: hypothetical protein GXP43_02170 [bacterium]|nr:hypothetical protein [bacterium]
MEVLVIDIETKKTFSEVGTHDPALLGVSYVGVYSYEEQRLFGFFEPELDKFWPYLHKAAAVIGYNIDGFDIPTLKNYYPGNLNQIPTIDLMKIIKEAIGIRLRLDVVAKTTLGRGKIGHGLDAIRYYHEKKWDELAKYCLEDVAITRDLYQHMKTKKTISYPDLGGKNIFTVPVAVPEIKPPPIQQNTLF